MKKEDVRRFDSFEEARWAHYKEKQESQGTRLPDLDCISSTSRLRVSSQIHFVDHRAVRLPAPLLVCPQRKQKQKQKQKQKTETKTENRNRNRHQKPKLK